MRISGARCLRGGVAGGVAAAVWALQQPVDKRAFGCRYDDVELLGRAVAPRSSRSRWYPLGLAMHIGNGALFGAAYATVAAQLPLPARTRGAAVAMVEHLGLWPLGRLTDRFHPSRSALPTLTGNRRAFWQAAWRHLLFGIVLGEVERRLNADPPVPLPEPVTAP